MREKGLTVKVEPTYQSSNYVVFRLQVLAVDLERLWETALREKAGIEKSAVPSWVRKFESFVGEDRTVKIETFVVPEFVQSKMMRMMPEMMTSKFAEKGMKAIPSVVKESDQESFFSEKLKELKLHAGGGYDVDDKDL